MSLPYRCNHNPAVQSPEAGLRSSEADHQREQLRSDLQYSQQCYKSDPHPGYRLQ